MKDIVIIKNSNTLLNNDVYFPDINEIENGELVLNNSTGKETLFVKNDADDIVPFRSKQYTLDKINTSIPTIIISETAPDKPKEGDFWIEPIPPIPFTLEFNVLPDNLMVTLPISGNVNCEIDWGNGSDKEIVTSDRPSHTYQTAGTYTVKINGDFEKMYNCSTNVTKIISWGNTNTLLINMDNAFSRCINLIEIPNDDYETFINVNSFLYTFSYCSNLVSIPRNLFAYCYNVETLNGCFLSCSGLTTAIYDNMFDNCYNVTNFSGIFTLCKNLKGSIPENLFANCPKVTTFANTFSNCSGLTGSIPENLFVNCHEVTDFTGTFSGCTGLTGLIPENLFKNNTKVQTFHLFFSNTNIIGEIPENLFVNNTVVTKIGGVFSGCTGLTGAIPENLFKNCSNAVDFENTFSGCKGLTATIPEDLFKYNILVTGFSGTFSYLPQIVSIPENLFIYTPNVRYFNNVFRDCENLASIPNNLFDNNKNVFSFNGAFSGCTSLTGNTPTGTDGIELWERANKPEYPSVPSGTGCFNKCYNLNNYSSIPSSWKNPF